MASQRPERFSWFQRQIGKAAFRALKYAGFPLRDPALVELFGFQGTSSGVGVDQFTAYNFSAYYSGVNLLASTIAMLPIQCVKVRENSSGDTDTEVDDKHLATEFFRDAPNPNYTPFTFVEHLQTQAITWGGGYARIQRDGKHGPPIAMWPMPANQIEPCYSDKGEKEYHFKARYLGEKDETYSQHEILQIPGFGYDGLAGQSVVQLARESIGLGLATEKFGSSHFGNNAVPGGIITHPGDLTPQAKENISSEVEDRVKGPFKARKVVVLDEGMKYTPVGIPPEDSQFLQTRQFQVREIARWLRIPPHLLFDLEDTNRATVEQVSLEFLAYSLSPWIIRWIHELRSKLLTEKERLTHTFRFDFSRLVMLDAASRFKVYSDGRNMGVYTLNNILSREGMPLLDPEVGDQRVAPSTMRALGSADPSTPIDPAVIEQSVNLIKTLGVKPNVTVATEILNATMPSAKDSLVKSIVDTLKTNNYIVA